MNTPIDFLKSKNDTEVSVTLRNGTEIKGRLVAFDLNTNIYIEVNGAIRFIQGQFVNYIY